MDYVYLSLGYLCLFFAAILTVCFFCLFFAAILAGRAIVFAMILVLAGAAFVGELKPISKAIKACVIGEKP